MKKDFSISWKRSKQPRKQRKYRHNAPLHVRQKFVHVNLSKDLRKKYSRRNLGLRKGDKIRILRGQFKKKDGKVSRVDLKRLKVYVEGIEISKKDGTKSPYALEPSNLQIIDANIDDKMRQKIINRSKNG